MAADLQFRIGADLVEIRAALAALRNDLSRTGQAARGAGSQGDFRGLQGGIASATRALGGLVAGFVSVAAAIKLIGTADELTTLNARLQLATGSTEEFTRAQAALFDLSQRTRTSLGDTVELYSRIALATKDASVGQETLLQVVETINQAVQLSGASAQAAQAALTQLGQGLASGTLRGEELNSILEQTPALADAIAKGMGITRGELRKYGEDGKITAEQVITALQAQREEVAQQFAQLPLTVGQAVTQLQNAGLTLVQAFNESSGATAGLAQVISDLANFLSSDEVLGAVVQFSATWANGFADIVNDVQEAVRIIDSAFSSLTGGAEGLIGLLVRAFRELPVNLRTVVRIVTATFAGMVDSFVADAKLMKEAFKAIFTDDTVDAAIARRNARVKAALDTVKDSIDDALNDREQSLAQANQASQQAVQRRQQGRQVSNRTGRGTFRAAAPSDAAKKAAEALLKAQLDAEEKLLRDSSQRALAILEENYRDRLISSETYYQARTALELEAVDQEIAIERRRLQGADPAERAKGLAQIELLERQKTDIARKGLRDQVQARRETDAELEQLQIQDLENRGQNAEAARRRLEAQYKDLLARMEAEGNSAGVRLIRGLIDTGVAKAQFDELKNRFDEVLQQLQQRQQAIAAQVQTGQMSGPLASEAQSQARQQAQAELAELNRQMQELAATTNDPRIKQGAEAASAALRQLAIDSATGVEAAIMELRASLANLERDFGRLAVNAGVDALTQLFTDLASGSKSAGDAIKDFVRGFVQSMAQIAARALATYLVLQTLDAIYPGLGRAAAAAMSVGANVRHGGGMAGQGPVRQVPAWLFAGAPRYHSGGMVGMKPDERAAILQTGEEVLSRNDPRNQANGGGNGYRIVNILDPSLVSGYLESSAGERSVLNVIGRNPAQVRQIIGA